MICVPLTLSVYQNDLCFFDFERIALTFENFLPQPPAKKKLGLSLCKLESIKGKEITLSGLQKKKVSALSVFSIWGHYTTTFQTSVQG